MMFNGTPLPIKSAADDRRRALYAAARAKTEVRGPRFWRTLRADIDRHGGSFIQRSVIGLTVYRLGVWAQAQPIYIRIPMTKIYGLIDKLVRPLTGLQMHRTVLVGDDFRLIHALAPISIHPDVVIGDRVGIMHNVTIGATVELEGVPIIGNDVFIGAGAVILGPVVIGDGARIAANSLVISDVPANSTAIGVPARALPRLARDPAKPPLSFNMAGPATDPHIPVDIAAETKVDEMLIRG